METPDADITSEADALALSEEDFYRALTSRNAGLISPEDQHRLHQARICVLGCGSTGGAVVEPLVRTGATNLVLADPGTYDLGNLNRQQALLSDLGRNKAAVHAERASLINPHMTLEVYTEGVTVGNVARVIVQSDLILDAVDVTTPSGLEAKRTLHQSAHASRIPVVCAYDIAGTQFVQVLDYRRRQVAPLIAEGKSPSLADLVPAHVVPVEMYTDLLARASNADAPFPQLAVTSTLLGALFPVLAMELLAGRRVRSRIVVDLPRRVRPLQANAGARLRQLRLLPSVLKAVRR